jgi:hypothetical protein
VNSQCINVVSTVGKSNGISIFDSIAESLQNHPAVSICKHEAKDGCGNVSYVEETILRSTHASLCSVELFYKNMVQ